MSLKDIAKELEDSWERELASVHPLIKESGLNLKRYYHTKNGWQKVFVEFCEETLNRFPSMNYVFIERDANPVFVTMQHFKEARGLDNELRQVALTRDMYPGWYNVDLETVRYQEALKRSNEWMTQRIRNRKTLLHDYLRQELEDLDNMLFVDTGFLGTATIYLQAFFDKKKTDHFLVVGKKGTNRYVTDYSEDDLTCSIEEGTAHGYQIDGLKRKKVKSLLKSQI